MLFLVLFTLTFAGTGNPETSRRVADIDDANFSFENESSEMEFAVKEDAVENIGDLTADDVENINVNDITVDGVKDLTNMTEVLRRRTGLKECGVYRGTSSHGQYLYLRGRCRHIQSGWTIYNWYGRSVWQWIDQSVMNSCRKGAPITPGAWLARVDPSDEVYAMYNGKKHLVVGPQTMDRCRFHFSYVVVVPQRVVDGYPTGPSIQA